MFEVGYNGNIGMRRIGNGNKKLYIHVIVRNYMNMVIVIM